MFSSLYVPNRREIFQIPVGASENIAIAFSPDGKRLAATGQENTAMVWDTLTDKELFRLKAYSAPVVQLTFSPDGTQLVTVSPDNEHDVKVWNSNTAQELLALQGAGPVFSVAFSPDGRRLATGSEEGVAAICDVKTARAWQPPVGMGR